MFVLENRVKYSSYLSQETYLEFKQVRSVLVSEH